VPKPPVKLTKEQLKVAQKRAEKQKKEADRLEVIMRDDADPSLLDSAKRYLEEDETLSELAKKVGSADDLVTIAAKAMLKLSEEQQLKAVITAYAFWIQSGTTLAFKRLIEQEFRKLTKPSSRTSKLGLAVRSQIFYADRNGLPNHKLISRDVQALRWLNSEKISPEEAIEKGKEKGEGLDFWARRWPKKCEVPKIEQVDSVTTPAADKAVEPQVNSSTQQPLTVSGPSLGVKCDFGKNVDAPIELIWKDNRKNITKRYTFHPNPGIERTIADCLSLLEAVDLFYRNPQFED
jgi:hypothetical protein